MPPATYLEPAHVLSAVIVPALQLMGPPFNRVPAAALLLEIQLQEDHACERCQRGGGPARGLWQMEPGRPETRGGATGVLMHPSSKALARHFLARCGLIHLVGDPFAICEAFRQDDVLACIFARLLLYTNRLPLPDVQPEPPFSPYLEQQTWLYYRSTWRPGAPDRERWSLSYRVALEALWRVPTLERELLSPQHPDLPALLGRHGPPEDYS